MTQPTIKVLQISQSELASFVSTELANTPLDGLSGVDLSALTEGEALIYSGSPLEWRNVPSAQGLSGGDGINVTAGSPTALIAVDSSVARRTAINTFQQNNFFTAAVSGIANAGVVLRSAVPGYILDMTGAGGSPDGKIWRVYASGNTLFYDVRNEANDTSVNWLTVERDGTTITSINFVADAMTFNGGAIHVGSPVGGGGGGGDVSIFGSPVDNQLAVWTNGNTIEGDAGLTWDGSILTTTGRILIANGDQSAPAYSFANSTDTGMSKGGGDSIIYSIGGSNTWIMSSTGFQASLTSARPIIRNTLASATVPNLCPANNDQNSGIGAFGTSQISIIAGSKEGLRLVGTGSGVYLVPASTVGITAFSGGGQVSAVLLNDSYNVVSTVAAGGDSVKLPATFAVGEIIFIKNDGANSLDVFPNTTDDLGEGADTAVSIASGTSIAFICTAINTTWTQLIVPGGFAQTILDIQTSAGGSPAIGSPLGAYTLVLGDELDKWIRLTASSIIVPPNATTAFTIGSQVTIFNISGAATTIAAGGSPVGTVIVNGVSSVDNDAGVAFIKVATDEWDAV